MVAYSALRQVCAPTAVEHSVSARFTTPHCNELIVVRRQVLQVFRVLDDQSGTSSFNESFTRSRSVGSTSSGNDSDACLELRFECQLSGNIESISVIQFQHSPASAQQQGSRDYRLPAPGTDALLLTFEEGKASLVAFDPSVGPQRALATLNVFDFEEGSGGVLEASRGGLRHYAGYGAKATALVDPASQCAVMLLYGSQLVVIPFGASVGGNGSTPESDQDACLGILPRDVENNNDTQKEKGNKLETQYQQNGRDNDDDKDADDDGDEDEEDQENESGDGEASKRTFVVRASSVEEQPTSTLVSNTNRNQHVHALTQAPFLLRLPLRGISCGSVRDLAFLHGYHSSTPVLLVLYTTAAKTSTARGVVRRHTCAVTAYSLTPNVPDDAANFTALWTQTNLPHDCFKVEATPCDPKYDLHTSRALVFSSSAIQVVGPNKASCYSMAVNGFAPFSVHENALPLHDTNGIVDGAGSLKPGPMGEPDASRLSILLSGVRAVWLDRTHCLISTVEAGVMMILTVTSSNTFATGDSAGVHRAIKSSKASAAAAVENRVTSSRVSLRLDVIGTCTPSTSMCLISHSNDHKNNSTNPNQVDLDTGHGGRSHMGRQYVFVGSRDADSVLVEAVRLGEREWERVEVKRLRADDIPPVGGVDLASEDALIYGSSLVGSHAASQSAAAAAAPSTDPRALSTPNDITDNGDDHNEDGNNDAQDQDQQQQQHLKFALVVRDRLSSCGPITSVTLGAALTPVSELEQLNKDDACDAVDRHAVVEARAKVLMEQGKYSAAASLRVKAKQEETAQRQRRSSRLVPMDREVLVGAGKGRTAGGKFVLMSKND
jgi:hypothetical protein